MYTYVHSVMISIDCETIPPLYQLVKLEILKVVDSLRIKWNIYAVHFECVEFEHEINLDFVRRDIFCLLQRKNSFGKLTPCHAINADLMGQLMIHLINKYKINETTVDVFECVCVRALRVTITITLANKYKCQ